MRRYSCRMQFPHGLKPLAMASSADSKNTRFSLFMRFPDLQLNLPYIFSFALPASRKVPLLIIDLTWESVTLECLIIIEIYGLNSCLPSTIYEQ